MVSPSSSALHSAAIVPKDKSFVDLVKYQHASSTVFTLKHPGVSLLMCFFLLLSPSFAREWKGNGVWKNDTRHWGWSLPCVGVVRQMLSYEVRIAFIF